MTLNQRVKEWIYDKMAIKHVYRNIKPDIAYRGEIGSSFDYAEMLCIDFIESSISAKPIFDFWTRCPISVIPLPSIPQSPLPSHTL